MKNSVYAFAVGIGVFGTTPDITLSPHTALQDCIGCPTLALRQVPENRSVPVSLELPQPQIEAFGRPLAFGRSDDVAASRAQARSLGRANLSMGYLCLGDKRRRSKPLDRENHQSQDHLETLSEIALANVRSKLKGLPSGMGSCWQEAPPVSNPYGYTPPSGVRAIRTHVMARPTGDFDLICNRNPGAIKCAIDDPSVVRIKKRLGATFAEEEYALVGDFRRFTAGVRLVRSFN